MKRCLILFALAVLGTPAAAQDSVPCASLQAQYETEFRLAVVKAIGTLDKKERCEIGREGMAILDKLAAAADNCPVQVVKTPPADATGLARLQIVNEGETIRDMVARRKSAFEKSCGR
ncbi:MAG: hypothetical protein AB7O50_07160 [Pseudolabrys sp.]